MLVRVGLSASAWRRAAEELYRRLRADSRFEPLAAGAPELDIVVWQVKGETAQQASVRAQPLFDRCAKKQLHLAPVQLPQPWFEDSAGAPSQSGTVTCLRSVLMKPEHETWLGEIWERLSTAMREAFAG